MRYLQQLMDNGKAPASSGVASADQVFRRSVPCKTATPFKDRRSGIPLCLEDDVVAFDDGQYQFTKSFDAEWLAELKSQNPESAEEELRELIGGRSEVGIEEFTYQLTQGNGVTSFPWGTRFSSSNPLFSVTKDGLLRFYSDKSGEYSTRINWADTAFEDHRVGLHVARDMP